MTFIDVNLAILPSIPFLTPTAILRLELTVDCFLEAFATVLAWVRAADVFRSAELTSITSITHVASALIVRLKDGICCSLLVTFTIVTTRFVEAIICNLCYPIFLTELADESWLAKTRERINTIDTNRSVVARPNRCVTIIVINLTQSAAEASRADASERLEQKSFNVAILDALATVITGINRAIVFNFNCFLAVTSGKSNRTQTREVHCENVVVPLLVTCSSIGTSVRIGTVINIRTFQLHTDVQ